MKIIVIGAGNIGLVTALCFADKGHQIFCVDIDQTKIGKLKTGTSSIYEPELDILLTTHLKKGNIQFSSQLESVLNQADLIFLAVGTPNDKNGQTDLGSVESSIADVARLCTTASNANSASIMKSIVIKSTVPPGTNSRLSEKYPNFKFISSPEFLREGSAIYDCFNPDRVVIGSQTGNENEDLKLFKNIYEKFGLGDSKFVQMNSESAELTKYAANIFLAARISLMNEFSRICEKTGADIEMLKQGLSLDRRIGAEFLNAGIGYGGSCFPKDIDALTSFAAGLNENLMMTKAVRETNQFQLQQFAEKILKYFKGATPTVCIWGASFKPETDDLREAPSLKLIEILLNNSYKLNIYDPRAAAGLTEHVNDNKNVKIFKDSYEALTNTDALVIATEWNEFKSAGLNEIKKAMNKPVIFDGRNLFRHAEMRALGFEYFSVGRS